MASWRGSRSAPWRLGTYAKRIGEKIKHSASRAKEQRSSRVVQTPCQLHSLQKRSKYFGMRWFGDRQTLPRCLVKLLHRTHLLRYDCSLPAFPTIAQLECELSVWTQNGSMFLYSLALAEISPRRALLDWYKGIAI